MHTYYKNPSTGNYDIGMWITGLESAGEASFTSLFTVDDILTALRAINLLNGGDWDGQAVLHLMAKMEES